jgi:hypothetical protein
MLAAGKQRLDQVEADEAGAAGDEDRVHAPWYRARPGAESRHG